MEPKYWIGKQEIWILFPKAYTNEHFFSSLSALVISYVKKKTWVTKLGLLSLSINEGQMPPIFSDITKTLLRSREPIQE